MTLQKKPAELSLGERLHKNHQEMVKTGEVYKAGHDGQPSPYRAARDAATPGGDLVPIGVEALQMQAADEIETRRVLDRHGYADTTLEQVIAIARQCLQRSVEDMLELGRCILVFRELPRGRYGQAIASIGLKEDLARRLGNVALKFLGHDHLKPLLNLDRSKVYELALLDDDALGELAADPEKLDQVERMSVSELKKSLREAKKTLEAKDAVIKDFSDDNAALREEKVSRTRYTPDAAKQDAVKKRESRVFALQQSAAEVLATINKFGIVIGDLCEGGEMEEVELAWENARWLAQQISKIYVGYGIEVDFEEIITPKWTRDNRVNPDDPSIST